MWREEARGVKPNRCLRQGGLFAGVTVRSSRSERARVRSALGAGRPRLTLDPTPHGECRPHASFLPPVLIFCAAAVVAVPLFRRLGLSARPRLPRGRRRHRPVRPVAHRRSRDRPRRRRARRRAPALHRRARAQAVAADVDAPRHLRARPRRSSAVTVVGLWRRRGRERARAAQRRRHRDRAGAVGDRYRAADARGARRPAGLLRPALLRDPPVPGPLDRAAPRAPAAPGDGRRVPRARRQPSDTPDRQSATALAALAAVVLVGRYGLNPFFRLLARAARAR